MNPPTNVPAREWHNAREAALVDLLAAGGDQRIVLSPETGLNRYMSSPYPRDVVAFASSTANDLSAEAFAHLSALVDRGQPDYHVHLDALRDRLFAAYGVDRSTCEMVFAPSGTDLEYVALAAVAGRAPGGIHNILIGADEVGSGCILSAHGRFFADETGLGIPVTKGDEVPGLGPVSLADISVRCVGGLPRGSADMAASIEQELVLARDMRRHALVHVVHGSKTGLILPELPEVDRLLARWGEHATVVVDACQARISPAAVREYLDRGAIVFLTGSKFMGGPPFSGFCFVPAGLVRSARALPKGMQLVFRSAEWPRLWPGNALLEELGNPGLALRLEASVFELERFHSLPDGACERVIDEFHCVLDRDLAKPFGFAKVSSAHDDPTEAVELAHPLEMRTLVTLDVSAHPAARTFDDAVAMHRAMALSGVRLGQPVKSVRTTDGAWAGTLRVGLSMPQIVRLAGLSTADCRMCLEREFAQVVTALQIFPSQPGTVASSIS